jgi:predicted transcriptional regulator
MSMTHYKLPIDTDVDKDIVDWINSFHRTKKGEMVRHAIRYYMAILEEGETIKFPSSSESRVKSVADKQVSQQAVNRRERKRPVMNSDALK